MALTFTGCGSVSYATSGSSFSFTTAGANLNVGDYAVLLLAYDNSGGGGADPISSSALTVTFNSGTVGAAVSTQTGLNDPGAASAGLAVRCCVYPVTSMITAGVMATVSWTGAAVVKTCVFGRVATSVAGGSVAYRTNSGATGANTVAAAAVAHTTPSVNAGELVLCWVGHEEGSAVTGDSDTTNGSWTALYGEFTGTGLTGMSAYMQAKTVTATATQTFNVTGTSSDWIAGSLIFTETVPPPSITQAAYQFFDDAGTEAGAASLAALNTSVTGHLINGDGFGVLRVRLQLTTANSAQSTDDWQLQWEKNGNGTWTNVTGAGTTVQGYNNPNLTDAAATTNRLGAGTGTFVAGKISETGLVSDVGITANNYTELVYSLTLKAANLVNADVLRFRVLYNGATTQMTYSVTPTINVLAPNQGTATVNNTFNPVASGKKTPKGTANTGNASWACSAVGSAPSTGPPQDATHPKLYYAFNAAGTTEPDATGNGNTAVMISDYGNEIPTDLHSAGQLRLVGSGRALKYVPTTAPVTKASVTFKLNAAQVNGNCGLWVLAVGSDTSGFNLYMQGDHIEWIGRTANNLVIWTGSSPTPPSMVANRDYYIAVTYDGATLRIYQDGVEINAVTGLSGALRLDSASNSGFRAGYNPFMSDVNGTYLMDDIRWWDNYCLTPTEVAAYATPTTGVINRGESLTRMLPNGAAASLAHGAFIPAAGSTLVAMPGAQVYNTTGSNQTVQLIMSDTFGDTGGTPWVKSAGSNRGPTGGNAWPECADIWTRKVGTGAGSGVITVSATWNGSTVINVGPDSGVLWMQVCEVDAAHGGAIGTSASQAPISNVTSYNVVLGAPPAADSIVFTNFSQDYSTAFQYTAPSGFTVLNDEYDAASGWQQIFAAAYKSGSSPQTLTWSGLVATNRCLGCAIEVLAVPVAGPVVYSDFFNRADAADLGVDWKYQDPSRNSWAITSNRANRTNNGYDFVCLNKDVGSPDMWVEADCFRGGYNVLNLRNPAPADGYTPNGYLGFINPGGGYMIGKVVGGGYSDIQGVGGGGEPSPYKIRLEVQGSTLRLYADGVLKITTTDTSITTGSYAGLNAGNDTNNKIDNFRTGALPYTGPPQFKSRAPETESTSTGVYAPGVALGDFLFICEHNDAGGVVTLAGWQAGPFIAANGRTSIIYKFADAGDVAASAAAGTYTLVGQGGWCEEQMYCYSGVNPTTPIDTSLAANCAGTITGVTATVANTLDAVLLNSNSGGSGYSVSNMTTRYAAIGNNFTFCDKPVYAAGAVAAETTNLASQAEFIRFLLQPVPVSTGGGTTPNQGTATGNWTMVPAAVGKRTPKATVVVNNTFNPVAVGKRTPKGLVTTVDYTYNPVSIGKETPKGTAATGNFTYNPVAVGKKTPKGTANTGNYVEAVTAVGYKMPKGTANTANYVETLSVTGKRVPKSAITISDTWVLAATGAMPVVGQKQGAATVSYAYDPVSVGKRTPKASATINDTFNPVVVGKKVPKGIAGALDWTEAVASVGKRVPKGVVTVTVLQTPAATGKRVPKGTAGTGFFIYALVAQGVAPVVGGMQGSAIVFWKEATVGGSPAGGAPPDSATLAYVTATGLDSSFVPALDGLVVGLKRKGLWAKMTAIYPFIGGTAALHRWNLLNPQDSDGAYRLTFYGGVSTHSTALGYRANPPGGTSNGAGYADTHCVPLGTLDQDSTHLAFYSLEDTAPGDRAEMGCFNWTGTSGSRFHIIARYTGVNAFYYGMAEEGTSNVGVPAASGLFVATRTATAYQAGYRNGAPLAPSGAPSIGLPPTPIWIGAINYFANKTDIPCGFASIGAGLGVQENADLYNVVQAYQTALARQIGTPMVFEGGDPNGGWAIGKRTPVGGNTVSATWTPAAVGKRDPKGAAVTGNYTETVTATGKKVPKGAATSLSYVETVTAAGKKVPKGVATTVNHTWALTAQGITPLIGFNKGNALANHTWVPAAVGSRTPKGASTIGNVFVVAAAGKRVQKGTGTVTVQWLPAATGKKPQQGAGAVNYEWRGAAVGSRTPKARGDTDYWFSQVALGVSGIAGQVKGQWNGQEVVEMCYGDKQVIEWLLVPS